MPKITAKFIDNEVKLAESGQNIIRDDELKGFGIRVSKGCISFIVECRVDNRLRRVTLGKYGAMPVDEARRLARKQLAGVVVPTMRLSKAPKSGVTLREVLAKFLKVRSLRPNSLKSYTGIINRCLGDWLDKPVVEITRDMVQSRHQALTKLSRYGTPGEAQANMAMRILRTMLNFAGNNFETADGQPIITLNPVKRLSQNRSWHRERRRKVVIPDSRLGDFYRALMSLRQVYVRDYLLLLSLTGLRRNEAATLRWSDIDFETRTITIRPELCKNKMEHRIPITDFLFLLLSHRKQRHRANSDYVFPGRRGGHMVDPGYVVGLVRKKIGFDFVVHDLRRLYISMAARIGIPLHIIKKLVNHVSSADVTDGYVVIEIDHLREPMAQINNRFLTLFGCTIVDWQHDNVAVGQWPHLR